MNTTPCADRSQLFDSTDRADHKRARVLCADCLLLPACREALKAARKAASSARYGPRGTWAGELVGDPNAAERRAIEETMFADDEARAAHAAWNGGDRSDRAEIGERVYQRRQKRRDRQVTA